MQVYVPRYLDGRRTILNLLLQLGNVATFLVLSVAAVRAAIGAVRAKLTPIILDPGPPHHSTHPKPNKANAIIGTQKFHHQSLQRGRGRRRGRGRVGVRVWE